MTEIDKPKKVNERIEREVRDISEQAKRNARFKELFSSEDGQEVFQQIMEMGGVHLPQIPNPNSVSEIDANTMIGREFIRSFCMNLMIMAGKDPKKVMQDAADRINRLRGHK